MKLQELRAFAGNTLHGRKKTAWFMAFSYPAVWLIVKAVPDLIAGALIFRKEMLPADIFFGRNRFWMLFLWFWNLLGFCILTPMLCTVCGWFSGKLGFSRRKYISKGGKFYRKALWFFGKLEAVRFLMLFPFVLFCRLAGKAFEKSALSEDAGIWLFLTVQCLIFALWSGAFYLRFCVNLTAVPFLFLENPDIPARKAVKLSGRILEKKKAKLFLILFTGFGLSRTVAMLILYLQIRIREYFQEQEKCLTFS